MSSSNRTSLTRRGFLLGAAAATTRVAGAGEQDPVPASAPRGLTPLAYEMDGLAPLLSTRTLSFHFTRHQKVHLDLLQELLPGTPFDELPLEEIIRRTHGAAERAALYNHAAELWNHDFYWRSMKPGGGGRPEGALLAAIERTFGDYHAFAVELTSRATLHFGSGWAWVVQVGDAVEVMTTANAGNPLTTPHRPLLALDLWEHAYYLDYQDRRGDYVTAFLEHLVDWDFAAENLDRG